MFDIRAEVKDPRQLSEGSSKDGLVRGDQALSCGIGNLGNENGDLMAFTSVELVWPTFSSVLRMPWLPFERRSQLYFDHPFKYLATWLLLRKMKSPSFCVSCR